MIDIKVNNLSIDLYLKIQDALFRIQDLYKKTNGKCVLSFSGGKDSTVVAELVIMAQEKYNLLKIPFVFADTKVEYDAIYNFVEWYDKNKYPITIIKPIKPFGRVLKEYGVPFASKIKSQFINSYQNNNSYEFYYMKNSLLGLPHVADDILIEPKQSETRYLWEKYLQPKNIHKSIGELAYANMAKKVNIKTNKGEPYKHYYSLNKSLLPIIKTKPKALEDRWVEGIENNKTNSRERLANKHMHILHPSHEYKIASKCCDYVKKQPFYQYYADNGILGYFTGVRQEEGGVRAMQYKTCTSTKVVNGISLWHKMPIFDWTDNNVEEFIEKFNVKVSDVYTVYGLERSGCVGCPFSKQLKHNLEALYKYEPKKYKATQHWFGKVYMDMEIELPFDKEYMEEYSKRQETIKERRYQMLKMFRSSANFKKTNYIQLSLFENNYD